MKKLVRFVLAVVIVVLGVVLFRSILQPQTFAKEVADREAVVLERVRDIRTAQQAFKQVYGAYTGSLDELVDFVLRDSINFLMSIGSADDSVAVATGQFKQYIARIPVIDTVFYPRKLTPAQVRELPIIPFSVTEDKPEGERFWMKAGEVVTESGVIVPVFEARASYNSYLKGLNEQQVSNKIDEDITFDKYPGIKVGDLLSATNDAINRE